MEARIRHQIRFEKRLVRALKLVLSRHSRMLCIIAVVSVLGALLQHILFPKFEAVSSLHIRGSEESPLLRAVGKISGYQANPYISERPSQRYYKLLSSAQFRNYSYRKLKGKELKGVDKSLSDASQTTNLIGNELIDRIFRGSRPRVREDLIEIRSIARSKAEAIDLSRAMAFLAQHYLTDYEKKEIDDAEDYLTTQLEKIQDRIDSINTEIDSYREGQDVLNISVGGAESFVAKSIGRLREESELVRVKIDELDRISKSIVKQIQDKEKDRGIAGQNSEETIFRWRGRLVDNLREIREQRVIQMAKFKAIDERLRVLNASLKPQFEQKIYDMIKKLDLEHNLYEELKQQLFDNRIYQIAVENTVRPFQVASTRSAGRSILLSRKLLFAFLVSLFGAAVFAYLWEQIYPVVKTKSDLLEFGVKYLGGVPDFSNNEGGLLGLFVQGPKVEKLTQTVHKSKVRNRITTTFQFLAARLIHGLVKRNGYRRGVATILSPHSSEGKSLISMNLAIALGSRGLRTLLVDGDVFLNQQTAMLNLPKSAGVIEVLRNQVNYQDVIRKTNFENLYFLSAGLAKVKVGDLADDMMKSIFNSLAEKFDVVIVDTPAFSAGPEALAFAQESDVSLVVTQSLGTRVHDLHEMIDMLTVKKELDLYGILNRSDDGFTRPDAYYEYMQIAATDSEKDGA